jgi:hypothetical protein
LQIPYLAGKIFPDWNFTPEILSRYYDVSDERDVKKLFQKFLKKNEIVKFWKKLFDKNLGGHNTLTCRTLVEQTLN